MSNRITCTLAVFALACGAQVRSQPIREFNLETVERLGRAIYEQDVVAWRAADVLRAENKAGRLSDSERAKIRGWIVVGTPEETFVKFIAEGKQGPYSVFATAFYSDRKRALAAGPPPKQPLTEMERANFRARTLAVKHIKLRCSDRYNTVLLPNTGGDGFLVYALAATSVPDLMVVGGHHRFTVSADGTRIVQTDGLARSCLTVSLKPSESGVVPQYVVVSHDVSNAPLETHVFLSLLHNKDIGVAVIDAQKTVWLVSKGKIRRLQ